MLSQLSHFFAMRGLTLLVASDAIVQACCALKHGAETEMAQQHSSDVASLASIASQPTQSQEEIQFAQVKLEEPVHK